MNEFKYLLIGSGRLSKHLAFYFQQINIPFETWSRSSDKDLSVLMRKVTHVLLAISDDAILPFYNNHPEIHNSKIIHFSGANSFDFAVGAHPLMNFTQNLYDLDTYKNIFFVIEESQFKFEELLPGLGNPNIMIPKEKKAIYHAMCVLGGNFPVILWKKVLVEFESQLGIPRKALWPYLINVLSEFIRSPDNSLTGPISRGDSKTIKRNLSALEGDKFKEVYQSVLGAL